MRIEWTKAGKADMEWIYRHRCEKPLKAQLEWIETQFPVTPAAKASPGRFDGDGRGQVTRQYLTPSPNNAAHKAPRMEIASKNVRRQRKSRRERSPLAQNQAIKVCQPGQKRSRPHHQNQISARERKSLQSFADNEGYKRADRPQVALRRSN